MEGDDIGVPLAGVSYSSLDTDREKTGGRSSRRKVIAREYLVLRRIGSEEQGAARAVMTLAGAEQTSRPYS